jgi:cellobiose phosphorylase
MLYQFIDDQGTFAVKNPHQYNLYLPLTNCYGRLLSSISPNLAGDIKRDNEHFLTPPASIEDIRSNLLCRREFFLKLNNKTFRLSYPFKDTLEAGFLYQKIIKDLGPCTAEILNFIPWDLNAEVMWIRVINKTKTIKITPTSFIPLYGRSERNLRDHRHVSSLLNRLELKKYGIFLKPSMVFDESGHKVNKTIYYCLGYEGDSRPPVGQFPTLDYFFGQGDILFPDAIERETEPAKAKLPEFDGKEACAAFRFRPRVLKPGQAVDYFLILGLSKNRQEIQKTFFKLNAPAKIKKYFSATKEYWQDCLARIEFDFQDKNFNNWLRWVKIQPTLRKLFGCSFLPHFDYGKGGRGWRDLWQDALALILAEPDKAKPLILHNFAGVRIDGSNATIITAEGDFIADRNRINRVWMDHGVWPYLTLKTYIHKTGDLAILLKEANYFRDHQLKRAKELDKNFKQNDYLLRDKNQRVYRGSILEHLLIQNLVQFFNVGRNNIIRLESADWNDGLDMAGQYGESAAFSFMYAHNLRDLSALLEKLQGKTQDIEVLQELALLLDRIHRPIDYSSYRQKQKRLEEYFSRTTQISGKKIKIKIGDLIRDLEDKAEHLSAWLKEKEWLAEGFFNGYYDNKSRRVEGVYGGRVRMMLASQVFAIMSEVPDREQMHKIWLSINRYLKDERLGGFRLNTDFTGLYLDLGRAFGFSYGDKENGAFFNHMVVMLANALYKCGWIKEGFEVLASVYKMATSSAAKIYPVLPEYFNNAGKGLYLYLTGSASWYIYTLLEEVLGLKFYLGDLYLGPKLIAPNFFKQKISAQFNWQDKRVRVEFIKGTDSAHTYRVKRVFLNQKGILPEGLRYVIKRKMLRKKQNLVRVYLG